MRFEIYAVMQDFKKPKKVASAEYDQRIFKY